nr:hypothetical protein [Tanacetum cinerariifolium]
GYAGPGGYLRGILLRSQRGVGAASSHGGRCHAGGIHAGPRVCGPRLAGGGAGVAGPAAGVCGHPGHGHQLVCV